MSAKTVDTAAAAYISVAEVLKRVDVRTMADLCSDASARLGSSTDIALMATALTTNVNFLALIRDACGEVESCCFAGGRYRPEDLTALAANAGVGAGKLFRLIANLVVVYAFQRRPDREMKQPWVYEQAMADLQALNAGVEIFGFRQTEQAGVPDVRVETADDVENRNGIVYLARRLFGRRSNRIDRT